MITALREAAPVLLGVLAGLLIAYSALTIAAILGLFFATTLAGYLFSRVGARLLAAQPSKAIFWWQGAVLFPITLIAATTVITTLVSFGIGDWITQLPPWLVDASRVSEDATGLGKLLSGALATFIGALWFDDAKDPTGRLWPSGQIKSAMETTFRPRINSLKAAGEDHLPLARAATETQADASTTGWSYKALQTRAKIIERYIEP